MKKEEEEKKEKRTLKELWQIPFYNSIIRLALWVIFFILLFFILSLAGTREKTNITPIEDKEEIKEVTYKDMKDKLLNNEQSITYTIDKYYLTGLINNNTLNATLEDDTDSIIKIKYDNDKIYQVKKEVEEERQDILTDINIKYLLPSNIIEIINDPKVIGIKSSDNKTYTYNYLDAAISVYLTDNSIEKIIILDNTLTYDLEFKEVVNEKEVNN